MPEWEAIIRIFNSETVKVKGKDWIAARANAYKRAEEIAATIPFECDVDVTIEKQLGEPWVLPFGGGPWYDLHGPGDVMVFERSTGNSFTADDVALLKRRIESLGLGVPDSWNGAGCNQVSYRCTGRKGTKQMTKKQTAMLLAPREGNDG